jgi:putative membrane protein
MTQHILLILVAAPLLIVSAPAVPLLLGLPRPLARQIGRAGWLRRLWSELCRPVVAWPLHAAMVWAWHIPSLYQAVLPSEGLHVLEHVCFAGTAVLFWWSLRGQPWSLMYLFTMGLQSGLLGVLITFSRNPWYPAYTLWQANPLEDQQLAGVIMWVPAGMVYMGTALALLWRLIESGDWRLERESPQSPISNL